MHASLVTSDANGTFATPLRPATDEDANTAFVVHGGQRWVASDRCRRTGPGTASPSQRVVAN